ncbi:arginase agmatinase formimionoglutamate hydrolase [Ophiostoma piceae UAMH 11346]|uniref:Arginase agmatinase formimionoglutamate hydrolase n=1 Tax=Ophiostoma piceae (strain UAMH 11346) TaxID=1262450 RepID=S3CQG3_OPHP1|nr:arginase agmatinase formimionoglutamate hydrolase [Ophiostoma piceae UAMH 11346]
MAVRSLMLALVAALAAVSPAAGCAHHHGRQDQDDTPFTPEHLEELHRKWSSEWPFNGIGSFGHLEYVRCLTTPSELYDIAIIGAPFDTAVSYRPGARFGPRAIRQASSRQTALRGFNPRAGINPYRNWARVLDCGDIPITPVDNKLALLQMSEAFEELGKRTPASASVIDHPRLITLGGDHSLALPALRALRARYGPLRVIHFDAHLDTWHPDKYPSAWPSEMGQFNHGSMFWMAGQEGLLANATTAPSVHAGLRTRLSGSDYEDWHDDDAQNWVRLSSDDMDDMGGAKAILKAILEAIGNNDDPVYLSVDIDVLDPAFAPGTGTPEPGGWTTRELIRILRGLEGLNIVGADVVEVAPAYQGAGEETALAAAQVVYEIMTSIVKRGMTGMGRAATGYHKRKPETEARAVDEL